MAARFASFFAVIRMNSRFRNIVSFVYILVESNPLHKALAVPNFNERSAITMFSGVIKRFRYIFLDWEMFGTPCKNLVPWHLAVVALRKRGISNI